MTPEQQNKLTKWIDNNPLTCLNCGELKQIKIIEMKKMGGSFSEKKPTIRYKGKCKGINKDTGKEYLSRSYYLDSDAYNPSAVLQIAKTCRGFDDMATWKEI